MTMFAIGDKRWPGISKLVEECGEVVQVCGKLMGTRGEVDHWDGTNLRERLHQELGDLLAAIDFVIRKCNLSEVAVQARRSRKLELFEEWHANEGPLASPVAGIRNRFTRDNPPEIVEKRTEDVLIMSDSIWCAIGDGEPFCNGIESAKEADDGSGIWFMLGTHNTWFGKYGGTVNVVEREERLGDSATDPSPYVARAEDWLKRRDADNPLKGAP